MSTTTEPTATHPAWCAASRCIPSNVLDDFEHRTIPRPITMKCVTGSMWLSDWGGDPDVEVDPSQLMVHAELESTQFVQQLFLMLSLAEARTFATALLVLAETAEDGGAR